MLDTLGATRIIQYISQPAGQSATAVHLAQQKQAPSLLTFPPLESPRILRELQLGIRAEAVLQTDAGDLFHSLFLTDCVTEQVQGKSPILFVGNPG